MLDQVLGVTNNRKVIIYNSDFDVGMMHSSSTRHNLSSDKHAQIDALDVDCAMALVAKFVGEWSSFHENFRWQSLQSAAAMFGHQGGARAHRALADCRAAAFVLKKLAAQAI